MSEPWNEPRLWMHAWAPGITLQGKAGLKEKLETDYRWRRLYREVLDVYADVMYVEQVGSGFLKRQGRLPCVTAGSTSCMKVLKFFEAVHEPNPPERDFVFKGEVVPYSTGVGITLSWWLVYRHSRYPGPREKAEDFLCISLDGRLRRRGLDERGVAVALHHTRKFIQQEEERHKQGGR